MPRLTRYSINSSFWKKISARALWPPLNETSHLVVLVCSYHLGISVHHYLEVTFASCMCQISCFLHSSLTSSSWVYAFFLVKNSSSSSNYLRNGTWGGIFEDSLLFDQYFGWIQNAGVVIISLQNLTSLCQSAAEKSKVFIFLILCMWPVFSKNSKKARIVRTKWAKGKSRVEGGMIT